MVRALGISGVLLALVSAAVAGTASAANPQDDVRAANAIIEQALAAARRGDVATARTTYAEYEKRWFDIEDGVRGASRPAYVTIETDMTGVQSALAAPQPDVDQVVSALAALDAQQQAFVGGSAGTAPDTTSGSSAASPTVSTLVDQLNDTQAALARNDYAAASGDLKAFESTWLDVEGQVKTRSVDDYRQTETDMALATTLTSQSSPEAGVVVARMGSRLQPYQQAQQYGVFDASIILLREGLEALLVIVALSAVLKRSASRAGQAWLWGGAVTGLLLSIGLGLAIQAFFGAIITPANRELLEGVIGLFAAAMLIYVSYWLHSKATLGGWQRYINQQTRQALQGGRLFGIALLAFLAVFREGAETALFYLGMASSISNADLLIGLAIGFAILAVLGVAMIALGVRVPMRPFFAIASVLVFYLCFKFIGTGIHSLQVAGLVPSTSATVLPSIDVLGVYPTWQTTVVQAVLLGAAVAYLVGNRVRARSRTRAVLSFATLLVMLTACAVLPFATSTGPGTSPAPVAVLPPAPVLTSNRLEPELVAAPRQRLEELAGALQHNDIGAARSAIRAYDADWNGIEVYVNVRSRALYGEIESHYEADITSALDQPTPDVAQILPLVQAMVGKYDEAIRLSDTGAPLSPLFDDLATVRTARAPLREVGPALKSGDTELAAARFAEFKSRWPAAQPLIAGRSPEVANNIATALEAADGGLNGSTVDALLTRYNEGINLINAAARATLT